MFARTVGTLDGLLAAVVLVEPRTLNTDGLRGAVFGYVTKPLTIVAPGHESLLCLGDDLVSVDEERLREETPSRLGVDSDPDRGSWTPRPLVD